MNVFDGIREWSIVRGLHRRQCLGQLVKLGEEYGELCKAVLKNDNDEFVDAVGDMIVVLTILAQQKGFKVEHCIESAYNVISKRTGKTVNGVFVKDQ